ncbi:P-loop NTPase fold protein [Pedobacter nyackensis]|uniref:P-loop NTPase fold protein n=1 Tax=Pedobacter nyackensis TaxID=475255 RepID=UPI00292DE718|nr:P-loop NTPase fold protein [Pedobacter nyackensis]
MNEETNPPVDRLEIQLKEYLYKKTNYAVMLSASWGAGKTHYLRNTFLPKISDTGYKGLIISLFGVSSIDDLKDKIFLALYPILENKKLKAGATVAKFILKSVDVTRIFGQGLIDAAYENFEDLNEEMSEQKRDWLQLDKLLICFDDLERADPNLLKENQILGYINSLVEESNIKVIILANEGKNMPASFQEIKEKIIGNTIHFQQNFSTTFEAMIKGLQFSTNAYVEHLRANESLILNFLMKENGQHINYRTLSYFLSNYGAICHYIQKGFTISDLNEVKHEIQFKVLRFCLMICVEHKKGKLNYNEKQGLDNNADYALRKLYESNKNATPKNYGEQIMEDYFPDEDYLHFKSLFNYLTGGDYFDENQFFNELCEIYHVRTNNIPEAYKTYNALSAAKYKNLSDNEYLILTRKLRDFAFAGHYDLEMYISLFYLIVRDGNVLNLDLQKLTDRFIRTLKKMTYRYTHPEILRRHNHVSTDGPFYIYYEQLFKVMESVNRKAGEIINQRNSEFAEREFKNNYDAFHESIMQQIKNEDGNVSLSGINPRMIFNVFNKADNKKKSKIILLFVVLYSTYDRNFELEDRDFLKALDELLTIKQKQVKLKNISGALFLDLQNEVKKRIAMRLHT